VKSDPFSMARGREDRADILIPVKDRRRRCLHDCRRIEEDAMPTETIIVVSLISTAFIIFAIVLAWGSRRTTGV
jgi:hypothetical protein